MTHSWSFTANTPMSRLRHLILSTLLASPLLMSANPLLTPSPLTYGYPQFDLIQPAHFLPAYEAAMAENLAEIDAIANNPAPATFENTLVALERAGRKLASVSAIFGNLNGTVTNPELQAIERTLSPKLAAHRDTIVLNPALFARIRQVHAVRDTLGLDAESLRLVERTYEGFVRAGANLGADDQQRLRALNAELATLHTTFAQNVLKERNAAALLVETREELAGLSDAAIATAAAAAIKAGHEGKYLLSLLNTTGQPPLSALTNRAVRERLMQASLTRNSRGGEFDNRAVISRIARTRAERAVLLGYATHADLQVADQTAGSIAAINRLMAQLVPPAIKNARREAADLQAMINATGGGYELAAWDWDFYTERVRQARYAFDASQVRPYFEMNRVLVDGIFFSAERLFGLTFKPRPDLPKYHEDTSVWEVFDADGTSLALFIVDWYARPEKRGGAWMSSYVTQSDLLGTRPVVANHLNVPKPPAGQPTLLTFDEVTTAFHEFGHGLHGLLSAVRYPRFSGTSVPRDFVEFPSQVYEIFADDPEVLANYARHHATGEPIPAALLEKIEAAAKFNQGFATSEYLAATLLDQAWHQLSPDAVPDADGVLAFEAAALAQAGFDFAPVPPRYRSPYFSHIFSSNGYAAGYYSYIWAEVLDADGADWIRQNGGLTRAVGDHLRRTVLSRGGSADAMQLYRDFAGREPDVKHLLQRRGLE
ncbi:MAG: M3 family metallopeptidase [Opitutaceae bacterium]|nr:M3 family metallopeptidase [Opitutaceae bacterium]